MLSAGQSKNIWLLEEIAKVQEVALGSVPQFDELVIVTAKLPKAVEVYG